MLFNKNNTGIDEAKSLIPFIYANLPFDNLKIDIDLSESDITKLIGKDVYKLANNFYHSDNYQAPDDSGSSSSLIANNELLTKLVHKIQLPVILHAFKSYSKNTLLSHSDKGPQIIVTETEKPAFEWQINYDNEAMLQKEYKALDDLIEFLDENIDLIEEWKNSEAYKESKSLFINSAKEFNDIYPINNSRRLFITIIPFIKEVERKFILPALTKTVFDELKQSIISESSTIDDDLLYYVKIPIVLLTMSISIKRLSVELLPDGVFQNNLDYNNSLKGKTPADPKIRWELIKNLEDEGMKEMARLEWYLKNNHGVDDSGSTFYELIPPQHNQTDTFFRV